jgi:hypothetical protein
LAQPPGPQLVLGLANKRVAQTTTANQDTYDPAVPPVGIEWQWHGGDLHLGAPERAAHWYYMSVQFEQQTHDAVNAVAFLNADVSTGVHQAGFNLSTPGGFFKWRLGLRANTLAPRFEGISQQAPVRITGFQIDALPIGSR